MYCEHYFLSQQLADLGFPNLGGASNRGEPTPSTEPQLREITRALKAAWDGILLDFTERLEQRQLRVSGVQTQPALRHGREDIPGQWAKEFHIDPLRNVITVGEIKFVDVWVAADAGSVSPDASNVTTQEVMPPPTVSDPNAAKIPAAVFVNPQTVPDFDDETIFALLEEHARRVVEHPAAKFLAAGKVSFGPILVRKMRHRFETKEAEHVLAREAAALEKWLRTKVNGHQIPTVAAICNLLRHDHRLAIAQSRAI